MMLHQMRKRMEECEKCKQGNRAFSCHCETLSQGLRDAREEKEEKREVQN